MHAVTYAGVGSLQTIKLLMYNINSLKSILVLVVCHTLFFGCTFYTHRVDKTIQKVPKTINGENKGQINIYRTDKLYLSIPILVYEDNQLVGELAGGDSLTWETNPGEKTINIKKTESVKCFMLNLPCIFNSDSIIADSKGDATNSLDINIQNNAKQGFLYVDHYWGENGELRTINNDEGSKLTAYSDTCEDIGFGILFTASASVLMLESPNELEIISFVLLGNILGVGGYQACMSITGTNSLIENSVFRGKNEISIKNTTAKYHLSLINFKF